MTFLTPLALLGLLLLSLPAAIHLLVRRRGKTLDFPSLRFLRETPSFKLYPRRFSQPLLLLLRAAAIALLVAGLARPLFISRAKTAGSLRFILIDASFSMKTRGRAEAAREEARKIVEGLSNDESAAIISLSSEAILLAGPTKDRALLTDAIVRYRPYGGTINYGAALARINSLLQGDQISAEADVISDFQQSGLEDPYRSILGESSSLRIVFFPVGSEIERNAFLSDERVRRKDRRIELSASEIVIEHDGRRAVRRRWAIETSEGAGSGIEWRTEANGQITGRLKVIEPDDFDADDERFFAFATPREERALLVEDGTDASLYSRAALESTTGGDEMPDTNVDTLTALPGTAGELSRYSLVVLTLHRTADENYARVLTDYARAGGTVWLFLGHDLDTLSWTELASRESGRDLPFEKITRRSSDESIRFATTDSRAPQLRGLDSAFTEMSTVSVRDSYLISPRATSDILIRWNDATPAFISVPTGAGRIMLLGTSPERASSDLGLSSSFPALVSAIRRASSAPREPSSQTVGDPVYLNVPPHTGVTITDGGGHSTTTKAREIVVHPILFFSEPGIYRLEFGGERRYLAFNALSPESERPLARDDALKTAIFISDPQKAPASDLSQYREITERNGSTWRYFLAAAFLLMIAELFVAMRQRKKAEE